MPTYRDQVLRAALPLSGLTQQILGDLDPVQGGVAWWQTHLKAARRILIGDYLIELAQSAETNLIEAAMHSSKAREAMFATGHLWNRGQRRTPRDEDRDVELSGNIVGFHRAAASVLDNIAGLVIGVAGLKKRIVRASIADLQLEANEPRGLLDNGTAGKTEQLILLDTLRQRILSGPPGWERWLIGMRNMLVHRARRLNLVFEDDRRPDKFYRPLPASPLESDIEALLRQPESSRPHLYAGILSESASDTMTSTLAQVTDVTQAAASQAVTLWQKRRQDPDLIRQPREQWPTLPVTLAAAFGGWSQPGPPGNLKTLKVNPSTGRRFVSAHLLDGRRSVWSEWLHEDE